MSDTKYPTEIAWNYFMQHHDNIREICSALLPIPHMETPQRKVIPLAITHTIEDFDKAVKEKDSVKLESIMNRAWLSAPEDRAIYRIPGFTEMCNLLDCTIDGFTSSAEDYEADEDYEDEEL